MGVKQAGLVEFQKIQKLPKFQKLFWTQKG